MLILIQQVHIRIDYLVSNLFKYILVEEKISKYEEHKVDIGINGHAIFESANYKHLKEGVYRILSQNSNNDLHTTFADFIFANGKIIQTPKITFVSDQRGIIIYNADRQVFVVSAHSSIFHNTLKVRLYRVE